MLRIALPNKGKLSEAAMTMLREAGYRVRTNTKTLASRDADNGIEFFYLRPRDIALYVGSGILDLGITGRDLLAESGSDAEEAMALGFGRARFHYAGRAGAFSSRADLAGRRIATSYPRLVEADLAAHGVDAEVVTLDGAVEVSIELGVADAIADVVETGTTLRQAGLETFDEPIMHSEAMLIASRELSPEARVVLRRLESVQVARSYVLIDYDIPADLLDAAVAVTPGFESPTVSPTQDSDWLAVRSMVSAEASHAIMDRLYEVGARAILVTSIAACRV